MFYIIRLKVKLKWKFDIMVLDLYLRYWLVDAKLREAFYVCQHYFRDLMYNKYWNGYNKIMEFITVIMLLVKAYLEINMLHIYN